MFGDEKNLKDSKDNLGITIKDSRFSISYTKTNKLITALYMVTDIIDKDEPLRNKLRTLSVNIISDINSSPLSACIKISEIMSFLDVASAVNIISEMNCNILRKEFTALDQAIRESSSSLKTINRNFDLAEFLQETQELNSPSKRLGSSVPVAKGHNSVGVQKGSTLMKALSNLSDKKNSSQDFDALKRQRRADILNTIKIAGGTATIKDIKDKIELGEKTLQRELVSMIKDNVLDKTGEKRWSRYSIRA